MSKSNQWNAEITLEDSVMDRDARGESPREIAEAEEVGLATVLAILQLEGEDDDDC
jgi:hypothetical protein